MNFLNSKVLIGGAILLLVLVGVFFAVKSVGQVSQFTNVTESVPQEMITSTTASPSATAEKLITVSATGFSRKEITIMAGESVTFVNSDSIIHTANSDPHPQHTSFQFINEISRLAAGEKKSLTFSTIGTYKYHDHLNPQFTGTVVVQ